MDTDLNKHNVPSHGRPGSGSSPRIRRAEQFSKLSLDLTGAEDLLTVARVLQDFCSKLWQWDAFMFSVRRGRGSHHFRSVLLIDTIDDEKVECTRDDFNQAGFSITWNRLLEGEPVLINRNPNDTPTRGAAFGDYERRSSSLMFVPVRIGDRVVGVLSLQSYTPSKFSADDCELLTKIAEIVGPTLLRCRAEERMQEFLQLGERLNQVVDTTGVARVVSNTASNLLGWDFLSLHLYEPGTDELQLVLGIRRSQEDCKVYPPARQKLPPDDAIVTEVFEGRAISLDTESISQEDLQRFRPFGDQLPLMPSVIFAPIRSMNRVIGLLCLQSESRLAYGVEEADIVRGLTDYCSGALERAWAQQKLIESEEDYRLLVQNVNDAIVISQDDKFFFFNERFAKMLEYEPDELLFRQYTDVYTAAGIEILQQREAFRNAGVTVPDKYETQLQTKSGVVLPVEANVRVIQNYHGKPATFAVIRDISERKIAEEQVRQSEEKLRTLFQAMTDTILVLDADGTYLSHHSKGQSYLVAPGETLAGKTLYDVFSVEKAEYFIRLFRRSLENNETLNIEYDLLCPAGIQHWYNASISPLSNQSVLLVARDVTERRKADEELFRSNARYKALLDGSEDYIFVLDRELRFIHINKTFEKRYSASIHDHIGKTLPEIYEGKEAPRYIELIQRVFETGSSITYDDDSDVNGQLVCTETVISPVFSRTGEVEAVLGISRDVTGRRQAAIALQESEQRYAVAVRGANDGIWDWNLETDQLYLSPRWWAIIGEPKDASDRNCPSAKWLERVHGEDIGALRMKIDEHIEGATPHLEDEHRIMHSDGTYRWVLCRGICVRDESGKAIQMAGSLSDITARKTAEEKLHYGASHDALTNLPNRGYFLDCLTKTMARARRRNADAGQFAVLFLDLDRFKVINDSLGHLAGDELIITTARRLEQCVRPGDLVARMGGDEFTILLEDLAHGSDATRIAQRFIRELSEPIQVSGFAVQTTVSIGIAFDRPEYKQPADLLRDADTAMYRAKATGRNRYQVFDQGMHERAMEQLQLEGDLRRAVSRQEFVMHYQPVYSMSQHKLVRFEALLRWNHPDRGLIHPGAFVEIAEENGLIVPIGWWAIDQAARACAKWNTDRSIDDQISVSINMSPRQFNQANLISHVEFLISNAGVSPSNIILEITENTLIDDSPNVAGVLEGLRNLGVRLDLDDFGTGYSSLSFLRKFPLDMLKVEKSFIHDLESEGNGREIVAAMISLGSGLGLGVTAEGVETQEQYDILTEMNCDYAQGYFFHEPVPLEKTMDILGKESTASPEPAL